MGYDDSLCSLTLFYQSTFPSTPDRAFQPFQQKEWMRTGYCSPWRFSSYYSSLLYWKKGMHPAWR